MNYQKNCKNRIIRKNNGGFTMVELLVSIMILLVVSTAVFSFMITGSRFFARSSMEADMQSEAQIMKNYMNELITDTAKGLVYYDNGMYGAEKCLVIYGAENIAFLGWKQEEQKVHYLEKELTDIVKDNDTGKYQVSLTPEEQNAASWPVMAEYVDSFSCDLAQVKPEHKIFTCEMKMARGNSSYDTSHTITIRNEIFKDNVELESAYEDFLFKEEDKVTGITLTPGMIDTLKGSQVSFSHVVTTQGNPDKSVTYSVENKHSAQTTISSDGLLTIGVDETAPTITVVCQSKADTTVSTTAIVNISSVTAVGIQAATEPVYENKYYFANSQLEVIARVEGNFITEEGSAVTWSITDEKNGKATIASQTPTTCVINLGSEMGNKITITAVSKVNPAIKGTYLVEVADIVAGELYVKPKNGVFKIKRNDTLQLEAYLNGKGVADGQRFDYQITQNPTGGKVFIDENGCLHAGENIPYTESFNKQNGKEIQVKVSAQAATGGTVSTTCAISMDPVAISFKPEYAIVVMGKATRVQMEVEGLVTRFSNVGITYKPAVKDFGVLVSSNGTLVLGKNDPAQKKYADMTTVVATLSNAGNVTGSLPVYFKKSNIVVEREEGCYAPIPGDSMFPDGNQDGIPDATTAIQINGVKYTYVVEGTTNNWYLNVNGKNYSYVPNSANGMDYKIIQ